MNTIQQRIEAITKEFSSLQEEDLLFHLIKRGARLPLKSGTDMEPACRIGGCLTQSWIHLTSHQGTMKISAGSDSALARGILSIVVDLLSDLPLDDARSLDWAFLSGLGLERHLVTSRTNVLHRAKLKLKDFLEKHSY